MLYNILRVLCKPLFKLLFFLKIENEPIIKPSGRLIICSNHIHLLDPILLAISTKRKISFLAKKELFENKLMSKILYNLGAIPVDRQGIDLKAIKSSVEVLKDDKILGIFPEGTRVKDVSHDNIKNGISYIALKGDSNILPVEIIGRYKLFSGLKLVFKDLIKIEDYKEMDKSEAYNEIALDVYKSIYNIV